jgi:hypothetical protein
MATRPLRDAEGRAGVVYWRRRAAALLVSMSVLVAASWGIAWVVGSLTGAHRPGPRSAASASTHAGSVGADSGHAASTLLGVPDATSARRALSATLPSCPVADIGLSLSVSQPSYSVQQLPSFTVTVTSTAGYSCTFDVGARHVLLQISASSAQVWTSAECAEGLAVLLATLHQGVPHAMAMTWDDQYSSAGCPVPGRAVPAGSYTARAIAGSAASNSVTFGIG